MKSRELRNTIVAAALLGSVAFAPLALAEAKKPKYTVKEVMKEIHKGEDNVGKRVAKGQASREDLAKLVEYYASLPLNDPPRGDKSDWLQKTSAMVKASEALKAGSPGAMEAFKNATNCKACHNAHKPEDKK